MGSLRSLRRRSGFEDSFQPSSVDQPDLIIQMGLNLFSACVSKNWIQAAFLLSMGADPNFVNPPCPSTTILELALQRNANVGFIRLLLQKGCDVSMTPKALLDTCSKHQVGKTELLLKCLTPKPAQPAYDTPIKWYLVRGVYLKRVHPAFRQ